MRKFVFATVFMILLLSNSALAFELGVSPSIQKSGADSLVTYIIVIENDQNYADEYELSIEGPNLAWIQTMLPILKLQPDAGERIDLNLFPTGQVRGVFNYTITASSIRYHGTPKSDTFTLEVLPPINIASFIVRKVNNQVEMVMDLEALGTKTTSLLFQVTDSNGMLVRDFTVDVEIDQSKRITKYIDVEDFLAGNYDIMVSIVDTNLYKKAGFTVDPISKVVQKRKVTSNPLWKIIEVTIENQGNVIEENYEYYQDIPSDAFTGFVTKPDNCFEEDGEMKCRYTIREIQPGMTANVIYRIDLWPVLGAYALTLMAAAGAVASGVKRGTRPKIKKRSIRKNGSEHTVFLELKNPYRKDIENIVVRDWVSPLATVVNKFDSVKPVIRKSDAGTELIWKLDKIEKKDDRILSYKIRTMINGEIKMPKAYIRYKNVKGEKGKVFSNPLIVK